MTSNPIRARPITFANRPIGCWYTYRDGRVVYRSWRDRAARLLGGWRTGISGAVDEASSDSKVWSDECSAMWLDRHA